MKVLVFIFITLSTTIAAQNNDINSKRGFAANGYDVVAYFDNEALEGNKKFKTSFKNVDYKFSSKKNLDLFIKNPEKYLPQYGGYCAYAVALKGEKVSINPKSYLIRNGKLYLFYDAWGTNTLELWLKENENELIKKANNNWETIKNK